MRETATSHGTGVRPWLVSILVLLALVVGGGVGALLAQSPSPQGPAPAGPACPVAARDVTWPAPATQVIRYVPPSTAPAPVALQPGQTLEVELFGHWTWQLRTPQVAPTLTTETPAGYLDAIGQNCVWRFSAQQAGEEELKFFGNGMCQGAEATCVAAFFNLTVTVRASPAD